MCKDCEKLHEQLAEKEKERLGMGEILDAVVTGCLKECQRLVEHLEIEKNKVKQLEAELGEKDIDIANIRGHLISSNKSAERRGETIKQLETSLAEKEEKCQSLIQSVKRREDLIVSIAQEKDRLTSANEELRKEVEGLKEKLLYYEDG